MATSSITKEFFVKDDTAFEKTAKKIEKKIQQLKESLSLNSL